MQQDISTSEFDTFSRFLIEACGIELTSDKKYLVENRLNKVMETHQIGSLSELVATCKSSSGSAVQLAVVDAMTTNETLWFRDQHPFTNLSETILPELSGSRSSLKVWSAACSTGQEPYSIAMTIEKYLRDNPGCAMNHQIIATDISQTVLDRCKEGAYDEYALNRGLPADMKERYFQLESDGTYRINSEIRRHIRFEKTNLIQSFQKLGKFDVIFCRNVLIYFPRAVKLDILDRIHHSLVPGGYLFVGASEGLFGMAGRFEMLPCKFGIIYRKL